MRMLFLLGLFVLLSGHPAVGQHLLSGFQNYRSLTVEDGLPSNAINTFARDSDGFMWIGTDNGLVRYDGSRIEVYQHRADDSTSISGNTIRDLCMDGDSILWIATQKQGLNKYRFETGQFTRYYPEANNPNSIRSEEVQNLRIDPSGKLWIGYHRSGFSTYKRSTDGFEHFDLPGYESHIDQRKNSIIRDFIFDKNDSNIVWINSQRTLVRYNQSKNTFESTDPYEQQRGSTASKLASMGRMIQADNGKIYITFTRFGVWEYDPVKKSWKNYSERNYNPLDRRQNSFNLIAKRDERSFWLTSRSAGLGILDLEKGYITKPDSCAESEKDDLCSNFIPDFLMDTPEGYWIGTLNHGLRIYNKTGNQFDIFTHQPDREAFKNRSSITSICQVDSNGLYYGGFAGEGVYYLDFKSETRSIIPPPPEHALSEGTDHFYTRKIFALNDSTLFVLSEKALFTLNTASRKMHTISTGLDRGSDYFILHRIFRHSSGRYYLCTRHNGVYVLNSKFEHIGHLDHDEDNPNSLVAPSYIYEICEDPAQRLWIGTENGFSVYDPKTKNYDNFDYKSRLDSVPSLKIIFKIALAPDSSIWFVDGRQNGVYLNYPYQKPYTFLPVYTGKNGIKERINNLFFDGDSLTVISTGSGLTLKYSDGRLQRYTGEQGLPPLHPLGPIQRLNHRQIVLGSGNKMVFFNPDSLVQPSTDIPLYLASIRVFDKPYSADPDSVINQGLELTYLQNFFSIEVGQLNFENPEEYKLSYRLAGLNDTWVIDPEFKAVFTNVPGGNYTFEARLLDKNNLPLEQLLQIPIEIIPPFWKTWWFRTLILFTFLLIVTAFYLIRVRSIRREAALTTAHNKQIANMELSSLRAQMNPHFLFNSLNSIRHQIISNKKLEADKYLLKFSRLVRLILNNSRQQLITLQDELEALGLYIELESSRFEHKFDFEVSIADNLEADRLKIPPILIQPYVENAIWHGLLQKKGSGKVIISVEKNAKNLVIHITDDGIGRARAKKLKSKTARSRESMGMEITGNRLEIIEKIYTIKCSAEIRDLKNQNGEAAGTQVILTLPIIYKDENSDNR